MVLHSEAEISQEAGCPGGGAAGTAGGGGGGTSGRQALSLVLRSLAELRETQGVTPHRVYRHIASKGAAGVTPGRLQLAMERAVRDGILVRQRGRYNFNLELPVPDQAWGGGGGCGCGSGSSSKPKRKRRRSGSSSKRCASKHRSSKHRSSKRRSSKRRRSSSKRRRSSSKRRSSRGRRRSSSSRRRCRRRRKPICGQMSLYKRLMRLLFPRKRCSKRKKRQPYTWVRKHCRRNPNHHRNKRR